MKKPVVILAGGGVDSTMLVFDAVKHPRRYDLPTGTPVHALFFDYGQRNSPECMAALRLCFASSPEVQSAITYREFRLTPLPGSECKSMFREGYCPPRQPKRYREGKRFFGMNEGFSPEQWKTFLAEDWVDGRMPISLLYGMTYAASVNARVVFTGSQLDRYEHAWKAENTYTDQGLSFHARFEQMMHAGGLREDRPIPLRAPLVESKMSKEDILLRAVELGVPIKDTYTCYFVPRCGVCSGCMRLYFLCRKHGIAPPPAKYDNKPIIDAWERSGKLSMMSVDALAKT